VGLLGGVLLDRLLTCGGCIQEQIVACEPDEARRQEIAARAGVETHAENAAAAAADVIVVAVPPPAVAPALRDLAPRLRPGTLVVSVAAAVPLAAMEAVVPPGVAVVWALPNTPALVGQSVTPVVYGRAVSPAARARAAALLACWGEAVEVPEAQMNRCVGLTAAAPTYILPIIDALARAGAQGIGKTMAALQWARNLAAESQVTVLYVCFEHDERYLFHRLLCLESAGDPAQPGLTLRDIRQAVLHPPSGAPGRLSRVRGVRLSATPARPVPDRVGERDTAPGGGPAGPTDIGLGVRV